MRGLGRSGEGDRTRQGMASAKALQWDQRGNQCSQNRCRRERVRRGFSKKAGPLASPGPPRGWRESPLPSCTPQQPAVPGVTRPVSTDHAAPLPPIEDSNTLPAPSGKTRQVTKVRKQTHSWPGTWFSAGTPVSHDCPHFTAGERAFRTLRCIGLRGSATSDTKTMDSFDPPALGGPQPILPSLSLGQTETSEARGAFPGEASLALSLEGQRNHE